MTTAHVICLLVGFAIGSTGALIAFAVFTAGQSARYTKHKAAIKAAVAKLPK